MTFSRPRISQLLTTTCKALHELAPSHFYIVTYIYLLNYLCSRPLDTPFTARRDPTMDTLHLLYPIPEWLLSPLPEVSSLLCIFGPNPSLTKS